MKRSNEQQRWQTVAEEKRSKKQAVEDRNGRSRSRKDDEEVQEETEG